MDKRLEIEGSPGSQLVQLMRKYGKNKDMTIDIATVKATDPELVIVLDSDGLVLERADLIIAESLTEYTRKYSVTGGSVTGQVDGFHGPGDVTSLEVIEGEITYHNELKVGEKVIVLGDDDTQFYYVLDRAVT